jgi:hypothetical protein
MRALLLKNLIYFVIIGASLLFSLWELARYSLIRKVAKDHTCPKCHGENFYRVHRHYYERVFGVGMHIRRYHCSDPKCDWEGLRKHSKKVKASAS